jgi:hypothetical protein
MFSVKVTFGDKFPNFLALKIFNTTAVGGNEILRSTVNAMFAKQLIEGNGVDITNTIDVITVSAKLHADGGVVLATEVTGSKGLATDHKLCVAGYDPDAVAPTDVPGYLDDKLKSDEGDDGVPLLAVETDDSYMRIRGIQEGDAIALADVEGLEPLTGPVVVNFDPSGLPAASFDNTKQSFVAYDASLNENAGGPVIVNLGEAAGADLGTASDEAAKGDHDHGAGAAAVSTYFGKDSGGNVGMHALPTGLPAGSEGQVAYFTGGAWVATDLATLVADALSSMIGTVAALEAGTHSILASPGDDDAPMGWAALEDDCDV